MIINGNINNDNEDKEVDDMLALLQAIRDYVISIAEKRGFSIDNRHAEIG